MSESGPEKAQEVLDKRYDAVARYLILANSGGAVAVCSFLGGKLASGQSFKWALLPLFCFYFGLIVAGAIPLGQLSFSWIGHIEPEAQQIAERSSFATRFGAWAEANTGRLMMASYLALIVGGISAVCAL